MACGPWLREHDFDGLIEQAARAHQVPAALVKAIIAKESSFNPAARSSSSYGLMQLYPPTAQRFVPSVTPAQLISDVGLNVEIGTRYLRTLLNRFGSDLEAVISAYNAGEGNATRATREYDFCAEWKGGVKPANAVVARDCVPSQIVRVKVGEFPNQRYYVDPVMDCYHRFLTEAYVPPAAPEAAAPYTGPAYGPDDPRGWRPNEAALLSVGTTAALLVLAGVAWWVIRGRL